MATGADGPCGGGCERSGRSLQRVRHFRQSGGRDWLVGSSPRAAARVNRARLPRSEVGPETAWAVEGGADLFLKGDWVVQATLFARNDHDVIDWLRATAADR